MRWNAAVTKRRCPRLLALVCVLSVFIPAFIMEEPVRSLFVPLALAVGFAMVVVVRALQHIRAGDLGVVD